MEDPAAFAAPVLVSSRRGAFAGRRVGPVRAADDRAPAPVAAAPRVTPSALFKLPKFPLPTIPNLRGSPNVQGKGKGEGKAKGKKGKPGPPAPRGFGRRPAKTVSTPKGTKLKIAPVSPEDDKAPTAFRRPLYEVIGPAGTKPEKFYNPKTARYNFRADSKGQGSTTFDVRVGGPAENRRANENGTFRNMDPYTSDPVWARRQWSPDEADVAVRAVLRNILGNAYLVEEEMAGLASEISCYKRTGQTKEFVRAVALSEAYKSRFFDPMTNMRFVELNFLHFYGRAAHDQSELSTHIQILASEGYNAEINSYMDSDEYDTLWGDQRVPQPNFRGGHLYNKDMNTLAALRGGNARSDRVRRSALLPSGDDPFAQPTSIRKGLPDAWRVENDIRNAASPVREFPVTAFWNVQEDAIRSAEIDWIARFGKNAKFWYKDSIVYIGPMTPQLSNTDEEVSIANATLKYGSIMAKSYVGVRYQWNIAPVIFIKAPTSDQALNGTVGLSMEEISFPVPSDLSQGF